MTVAPWTILSSRAAIASRPGLVLGPSIRPPSGYTSVATVGAGTLPDGPAVQIRELALKVCLVVLPRHAVHARGGVASERVERLSRRVGIDVVEERGEPCSFFLCLAACRTRSSAWVTRARIFVRCVLCWSAFPLAPALGSTASSAGCPASFVGFSATMAGSDFSRPFIVGYGSSPSRRGPAQHGAPGRTRDLPGSDAIPSYVMGSSTTAERQRLAISAPHMLPSALSTPRPLRVGTLSRLNSPPHTIAVYASQSSSPATTQHSLPGGRYSLPGPDFHRLDHASFPGALTAY